MVCEITDNEKISFSAVEREENAIIYAYTYIHICEHIHINKFICICIHIHILIRMQFELRAIMSTFAHVCVSETLSQFTLVFLCSPFSVIFVFLIYHHIQLI